MLCLELLPAMSVNSLGSPSTLAQNKGKGLANALPNSIYGVVALDVE